MVQKMFPPQLKLLDQLNNKMVQVLPSLNYEYLQKTLQSSDPILSVDKNIKDLSNAYTINRILPKIQETFESCSKCT